MSTVEYSKKEYQLTFKECHPPLWISFWANKLFIQAYRRLTGTDVGYLYIVEHGEITGYMQGDGPQAIVKSLHRKLPGNWIRNEEKFFDTHLRQLLRTVRQAKTIPPSPRVSKHILADIYRQACTIYPFSNAFYMISKQLEPAVQERAARIVSSKKVNAIMATAGTPIKATTMQRYQHDLHVIAKKLKRACNISTLARLQRFYKTNNTARKEVDHLQQQYRYLTALNAGERTATSFFPEIIAALNIHRHQHTTIPASIQHDIRILRSGSYFKDEISSAIIPHLKYELADHWHAVAKGLHLSFAELEELTADQALLQTLTPNQAKKIVRQQRQKTFFAHLPFQPALVMRGVQAIAAEKKLKKKTVTINLSTKSFSGQVGSPGMTRGIVQIITHSSDIKNFSKGNILVTIYTAPEYVPAMKLAKAVITDTGGITSHAAIVSRELKKPCIVNTKIATQLLRDGDEVEVDAHQGTITILKRKRA